MKKPPKQYRLPAAFRRDIILRIRVTLDEHRQIVHGAKLYTGDGRPRATADVCREVLLKKSADLMKKAGAQ